MIKKVSFKKKFLYSSIFLILTLLLLELILRIYEIEYPLFQKHDSVRGFSLVPNASGKWNIEGGANVKINSDGLRDFEHNLKKTKNLFRIAIIGDSFAEARSVNVSDTFWFKLNENLKSCKNNKFNKTEVINFGVSGYSTTQEYLTIKNNVWKYDPDLILLNFYIGNDIEDNSKILSNKKYIPFFNLVNGNLKLDNSFKDDYSYKLLSSNVGKLIIKSSQYSRIIQLIRYVKLNIYQKNIVKKKTKKENFQQIIIDGEVYNKNLNPANLYNPSDKAWKEAWIITEKILELINDEIKDNDKDFIVNLISPPLLIHTDVILKEKKNYLEISQIKDLEYPNKRLKNFLKARNIKYIDSSIELINESKKTGKYFHGFDENLGRGHWNELGHNKVSKIISSEMCNIYK